MNQPVVALLLLYATFAMLLTIVTAAQAALCILTGRKVRTVVFFAGPKLISFSLHGIEFELRPVPLTVEVAYHEDDWEERSSPWLRAVVQVSGVAAACLICVVLLESPRGEILRGLFQIVGGALDPFGYGRRLVENLLDRLIANPGEAFGVSSAKLVAFAVLPFPLSPLVLATQTLRYGRRPAPKPAGTALLIAFAGQYGLVAGWMIASVTAGLVALGIAPRQALESWSPTTRLSAGIGALVVLILGTLVAMAWTASRDEREALSDLSDSEKRGPETKR